MSLRRMAAVPGLEAQTTFAPLRHGYSPHLYVGQARHRLFEGMGRGDSEEGEPQGAGDAPLVYSVGTLPELRACNQAVAADDGWARGYLDDVLVFGEGASAFDAVVDYVVSLLRERRLHGAH